MYKELLVHWNLETRYLSVLKSEKKKIYSENINFGI